MLPSPGLDALADTSSAESSAQWLQKVWRQVCLRLTNELGDGVYESWLKPLRPLDVQGGKLILCAPTRFMRDWVQTNYAERIRTLWSQEGAPIKQIDFYVSTPEAEETEDLNTMSPHLATPQVTASSPTEENPEALFDKERVGADLDPRFTFDNFVVGKPNELAHAAARRVAESTAVSFNPLFLYGGVGLGKTHLMHAIAWHIRQCHPERRVIYLSAEKFMYQFIRSLRYKDTMAFKMLFRSVDVLMIDDVQFISGKESTQEEFFHTFNALVDQNRQIIISADKSPSDLEGMEERMRSRLGWGLVADIHPTTYELRLGILQAKAEQMAATIPHKVMEFLAHKITSNVRELEGALNRIAAHAMLVGRDITLENTQECLRDLLRANDRRLTVEEIQRKVAEHFKIRVAEMHSASRLRAVARPRQIAMYLSKELTSKSLPEIGRKFGGRDHTTVMHAIRKVPELIETDKSLREDINLLRSMLQN